MKRLLACGMVAAVLLGCGTAALAAEKDWSHHKGKLPFIIGYEKGLAEAKFSGRPMMLFFTTTW